MDLGTATGRIMKTEKKMEEEIKLGSRKAG